ncbi:MAG: hypothetical protein SF182_01900 [Deltaproteobacteria bacterium]|nr:hypothetical protein [Deltaproteobacteria bacterium]
MATERRTNGHAAPNARELLDDTARLRGDLAALGEHTTRAVAGWRRYLRARLDAQPYATIAVAAGVGCVLGGGLPSPVLRLALAIGGRLAAERVLGQVVGALAAKPDE